MKHPYATLALLALVTGLAGRAQAIILTSTPTTTPTATATPTPDPLAPLDLGRACSYAILASSGITNQSGTSPLQGDIGSDPTATLADAGTMSWTGTNTGAGPITQGAQFDLGLAFSDGMGRPNTPISIELGGTTLQKGVYSSGNFTISGSSTFTLDGNNDPDSVFIFQSASTLEAFGSSHVILTNQAQAKNVFWVVGSSATLYTDAAFLGNILAYASITLQNGATVLEGRLLAETAHVTIDKSTVNITACLGSSPTPSVSPSASASPSSSPTASPSPSESATSSVTASPSASATVTVSATNSPTPNTNTGAVGLGAAGSFSILAKTGISSTGGPSNAITGDIGVSPNLATAISGDFALTMDPSGQFSTSTLVTGNVYAADYSTPTPANLTTAVLDMETAYTDAAGRAPTVTELLAGNLSGQTLVAGVYKFSSNVHIPTDLILTGNATDVWIFEIAGTLNIASSKQVIMAGGALGSNVFWQVAGSTTLGTYSTFYGTILDQTLIAVQTGARLNGRALAQSAVTLDSNAVDPAGAVVANTPTNTSTPSPSSTQTPSPTWTVSGTSTPTRTASASATVSATSTRTPVGSPTSTPSATPVLSSTPVVIGSATPGTVVPSEHSYFFPSPARGDNGSIAFEMKQSGEVIIKIHNQTGRLVDSISQSRPAGWQTAPVSLGRFAAGTYYYVLTVKYANGESETQAPRKFVVLH